MAREKKSNLKYQVLISLLLIFTMAFTIFEIENTNKENVVAKENQVPQEREIVEAEPESEQVTMVMVGDVLLHDIIDENFENGDGTYDYTNLFANVKGDISGADIALVNQEVIIGGADLGVTGYPEFNAPYQVADALDETGFDVILHATNHALDRGKKGLLNCIEYWRNNYPDMAVLGIHDSQESQDNIYVYEQDGIKIAILNYTYGTNGEVMPSGMPYAVDLLDEEKVVADINRAKEISDFIVVCPHWGTEYKLGIDSKQEKWTNIFLENGVDLVIGTHPHVIEPIEMLTDENTGHQMLVYYSLGNFCSWTSDEEPDAVNRSIGGMAEVVLQRRDDGQVYIADYGVQPLVCHLTYDAKGVTVYKLQDYTEELAGKSIVKQKNGEFSIDYCNNLCDEIWGELWKKDIEM